MSRCNFPSQQAITICHKITSQVYSHCTISKYHMYERPKLGSESIQGLRLHSETHGQQHGNYMRSELWGSAGWTTIAWRRRPCRLSTTTSSIYQSINRLDILSYPNVSVRVGRKTEDKKSICRSTRNDAQHFSFSCHRRNSLHKAKWTLKMDRCHSTTSSA